MSDLKPGKYLIVPAAHSAPPPFPVGANATGGPIAPVIVGGKNNVWLARDAGDGNFALVLQQGGTQWLSLPTGDNVSVGLMPGPMSWAIRKHGEDECTYTIELPGLIRPSRAWTLESPSPGSQVKIGMCEIPRPEQLFRFIPVPY